MLTLLALTSSLHTLALAAPTDDNLVAQWGAPPGPPVSATASSKKRNKTCFKGKRKKNGCKKRRSKQELAILEADQRRQEAIISATPLVSEGQYGAAADALTIAAESESDPVLFLAAAEARLADQEASPEDLALAADHARRAEGLTADPERARIAPQSALRLVDHSQQLSSFVDQRRQGMRLYRRARGELMTGVASLTVAASGIGLLIGGAVLAGRIDKALAHNAGPEYQTYRESLDPLTDRSDTMLAAGLVTALVGTAIGLPLTLAGARDRKRSLATRKERPHFRIAPSFSGVFFSGQF